MANRQSKIVGSGQSGGSAVYISGDAASGLTATGSTQGTALPLTADNNAFAIVAASTGAILINGAPGDECFVYNGGANALTVYPPVGGTINNLAANTGFSVATTKAAAFVQIAANAWAVNLGA